MCLGIPGKILDVTGDGVARTGRVDFGGVMKQVSLAFTPESVPGEYVIVHVGFAIARLDEIEASRVFAYLDRMDELKELEEGGP